MYGLIDRKITAITVGCLVGAFVAWQELSGYATDGLTLAEWALGILKGIFVGGGGGLLGFYATRWVDRHIFGDEEDE